MEDRSKDFLDNDSEGGANMGERGLQFVEQFEMSRVLEKFYEEIRAVVAQGANDSAVAGDTDLDGRNGG